ncbi:MAG: sensor histidine kinase, partial [Paraclostridium sp.]
MKKINDNISLKPILYTSIIICMIVLGLFYGILMTNDIKMGDIRGMTLFIRAFNVILSILAVGSCYISYNRLKKDNMFLVLLFYLILAIDVSLGRIDYANLYQKHFIASDYITISTSLLRVILLILATQPKNKITSLIIENEKKTIISIVIYCIVMGYIENKLLIFDVNTDKIILIAYNIFLILAYVTISIKLFIKSYKKDEYIYLILGSSIVMLTIKAICAIYGVNSASINLKILSVSVTYLTFLIIIFGLFIEMYISTYKNKNLENKFETFYNLIEFNKHSAVVICSEDHDLIYTNEKMKKFYKDVYELEIDDTKLNKVQHIYKDENIIKKLYEDGSWSGTLELNSVTLDCWAQWVKAENGEKNIAVTFRDVSDEKDLENKAIEFEKFKAYDKAKSDFIANISHEIRTPLNIFYSTIQLLDLMSTKENIDFREYYYKYRQSLELNCHRMLRLTNNIIDINKFDEGALEPYLRNIDIVILVESVTMSVVPYSEQKNINVIFDTEVEEHIIKCDSSMIERAVLNLLSNAIKFTNENGDIYVDIYLEGDYVKIRVKDTGVGIDEDIQKRIFDRFVQADK